MSNNTTTPIPFVKTLTSLNSSSVDSLESGNMSTTTVKEALKVLKKGIANAVSCLIKNNPSKYNLIADKFEHKFP